MGERASRITQPLCLTCKHPRSFHGDGGRCKALGCTSCLAYVSPLMQDTSDQVVSVGQVWADNDPRKAGRLIRVDRIEVGDDGEQVAVVTVLGVASGVSPSQIGKTSRVKVRRFRPVASGYLRVS